MLKKIVAALLVTLLLLCPMTIFAAEDDAPLIEGVSSVVINKKATRVSVTVTLSEEFRDAHPKTDLHVFRLAPGRTAADLAVLTPEATFRVTSRRKLSLPLVSVYDCYVAAIKAADGSYTVVGHTRYIENVDTLATVTEPYPDALSIKGLQVSSVSDALSLGVSHAVLPLPIETVFASAGPDAIPYDAGGVTYHFDRSALLSLDDKISSLSREGVRVYLRIQLDTHPADLPASLASLGYTDAPVAPHYTIRVDTPKSAGMVAALLSMLADRYANPESDHGFCASFIMGNAVNMASQNYAHCPDLPVEDFTENYANLVRMAHIALTSVYSRGRVFISLSNHFSMTPAGLPLGDVSSAEFLSAFNHAVLGGGDFDWAIASDAYAYNRSDSSIWDDVLATGASTQLISPTNISTLTQALSKAYLYDGQPRRLIIGNFAVPSVAGGAEDTSQAASYSYAYYKTLEDGSVDALIYSDQFDTPDSAGGLGLATTDMSGNILNYKAIWHTVRQIDTQSTALISARAARIGGVVQYLYTSMNEAAVSRHFIEGTAQVMDTLAPGYSLSQLFDFSGGQRHGFVSAGYGYPTSAPLVETPNGSAIRLEGCGDACLINYEISKSDVGSANLLALTLDNCTSGTLTLRLSQGGKLVYVAPAQLTDTTGVVIFDVKEFKRELASGDVTMSISLSSGCRADLVAVSATRSTSMSTILWVIVLVFAVLLVLTLLLALFNRLYHKARRRAARGE